jgi:tetratricopeptide (TPR) repeat protein
MAEFKRAAFLHPKGGESHLNLGYVYFSQGRMEEAIQAFQKAIELSPRLSPDGHNNLGAVYLSQGRKNEAIEELQLAIQERPHYARPYSNLGKFYEEEGDIDRAIFYLEKSAKLEPEFVPVHIALARLYEKKGWREKSQEAQKNYLKHASLGIRIFVGD